MSARLRYLLEEAGPVGPTRPAPEEETLPSGPPRRAEAVPKPQPAHELRQEDPTGSDADPACAPLPETAATPLDRARHFARAHVLVVAVIAALAVGLALFWALRARPVALGLPIPSTSASVVPAGEGERSATPTPSPTPEPKIVVHVLGAVHHPGVVSLREGARVQDAVKAAGGMTKAARPGELNLAQVLLDGEQIIIGTAARPDSEVRGGAGGGPAPGTGGTASGARLDLNSATQAQLEALPGVGPVTAQSILGWREEHGRFSRVEELQEIDGIGPKTFARLEPYVRV